MYSQSSDFKISPSYIQNGDSNPNYANLVDLWNDKCPESFRMTTDNQSQDFFGTIRVYYFDKSQTTPSSYYVKASSQMQTTELIATLLLQLKLMPVASPKRYRLVRLTSRECRLMEDHEKPLVFQLKWLHVEVEGIFLLVTCSSSATSEEISRDPQIILAKATVFRNPISSQSSGVASNCDNVTEVKQKSSILANKLLELQAIESMISDERVKLGIQDKIIAMKFFTSEINPHLVSTTKLISIYDSTQKIIDEIIRPHLKNHSENSEFRMTAWVVKEDEYQRDTNKAVNKYLLYNNDKPLEIYQQLTSKGYIVNFHIENSPAVFADGSDIPGISRVFDFGLLDHQITAGSRCFILLSSNEADSYDSPADHPSCVYLKTGITLIGRKYNELRKYYRDTSETIQIVVFKEKDIKNVHCCFHFMGQTLVMKVFGKKALVRVDGKVVPNEIFLNHNQEIIIGQHYRFRLIDSYIKKRDNSHQTTSRLISASRQSMKENCGIDAAIAKFDPGFNCQNKLVNHTSIKPPNLPYILRVFSDLENQIIECILLLSHHNMRDCPMIAAGLFYLLYINLDLKHSQNINSQNELDKCTTFLVQKFSTLKVHFDDATLVFWLANLTELTNILKCDNYFCNSIHYSYYIIHDTVIQLCETIWLKITGILNRMCVSLCDFDTMVECSSVELEALISSEVFLEKSFLDKVNSQIFSESAFGRNTNCSIAPEPLKISDVLFVLNTWLAIFCITELNPLFIVQFFSKIFDEINKKIIQFVINQPVCSPTTRNPGLAYANPLPLQIVGKYLNHRINILKIWAENQGLETALSKNMLPSLQLMTFLCEPKDRNETVVYQASQLSCFSQTEIITILKQFRTTDLMPLPEDMIEKVSCSLKVKTTNPTGTDDINCEKCYNIPFIVPNDINFCENLNNFFDSSVKLLRNFTDSAHCQLIKNDETNKELWRARFEKSKSTACLQQEDHASTSQTIIPCCLVDVETDSTTSCKNSFCGEERKTEMVRMNVKRFGKPLGINIVSVTIPTSQCSGLFVKSILSGSVMADDGRLCEGDQLLAVNGISLSGLNQTEAAQIIRECGDQLSFEVLKNSAVFYGFGELFPTMERKNFKCVPNDPEPVTSCSSTSISECEKCPEVIIPCQEIINHQEVNKVSQKEQARIFTSENLKSDGGFSDRVSEYNLIVKKSRENQAEVLRGDKIPLKMDTNVKYQQAPSTDSVHQIVEQHSPIQKPQRHIRNEENTKNTFSRERSEKCSQPRINDDKSCRSEEVYFKSSKCNENGSKNTVTLDAKFLYSKIKNELESIHKNRTNNDIEEKPIGQSFTRWSPKNSSTNSSFFNKAI